LPRASEASRGEPSHILVSLATISAILLALIAALLTAYYVYLQGRLSPYRDAVVQDKIEIRRILDGLNGPDSTEALALPPDFMERCWDLYPDVSLPQLILNGTAEVTHDPSIFFQRLAGGERNGNFGPTGTSHLQSRAYFAFLVSLVNLVSGRSDNPVDVHPRNRDLFPESSEGAGFEPWRRDFRLATTDLENFRRAAGPLYADLKAWFAENGDPDGADYYNPAPAFDAMDRISRKLEDVESQEIPMEAYRHFPMERIYGSLFVAFLVGVCMPLFLAAWRQGSSLDLRLAVAAVLALWLAGLAAAGLYLGATRTRESRNYLRNRWYQSLLDHFADQRNQARLGCLLDGAYLREAINAPDQTRFPRTVHQGLTDSLASVQHYDQAALALDDLAVSQTARSGAFTPLTPSAAVAPRFGRPFYLWELADPRRQEDLDAALQKRHPVLLEAGLQKHRVFPIAVADPSGVSGTAATREAVRKLEADWMGSAEYQTALTARQDALQKMDSLERSLQQAAGK
jgi:hypothetical protein